MNDDLLTRAARALREQTADDDASARFTRARVLASLHQARVTRRKRLAVVIPVAASFAMATAYAAASGKLPRMITTIVHALGGAPEIPPPSNPPPVHAGRAAPRTVPRVDASAIPPPPVAAPAPTETAQEPPPRPSAAARGAAPEAATRSDLPDENDPGFALYRTAHRAHFVDHDPARALVAWDAYLAETPTGRFALEARYNRALCLVRLGRHAEARAALEPFARGDYGGYRRREATDLLQALADAGSP